MASVVTVTENELLDALVAAGRPQPAPPHARTTAELCVALGLRRSAVKARLATLRAAGQLEVWRVTRTDAAGRPQLVPAYTITPAPKGKR